MPAQVPPRVQAAQQFLHYIQGVRQPSGSPFGEQAATPDPVELSPKEKAAYESAMMVMMLYFNGEMDYGDVSPVPIFPDEDNPTERVLVTES